MLSTPFPVSIVVATVQCSANCVWGSCFPFVQELWHGSFWPCVAYLNANPVTGYWCKHHSIPQAQTNSMTCTCGHTRVWGGALCIYISASVACEDLCSSSTSCSSSEGTTYIRISLSMSCSMHKKLSTIYSTTPLPVDAWTDKWTDKQTKWYSPPRLWFAARVSAVVDV